MRPPRDPREALRRLLSDGLTLAEIASRVPRFQDGASVSESMLSRYGRGQTEDVAWRVGAALIGLERARDGKD